MGRKHLLEKGLNREGRLDRAFKGQIKAKEIFVDFDHLRPGDFKISNEISIWVLEPIEIACRIPFLSQIFQKNRASKRASI